MDLQEGEEIVLPCRQCSSVSLKLTVCAGTAALKCERCGGVSLIAVGHGPEGWTIRAAADVRDETLSPEGQGTDA